jgi:hypothetical protein
MIFFYTYTKEVKIKIFKKKSFTFFFFSLFISFNFSNPFASFMPPLPPAWFIFSWGFLKLWFTIALVGSCLIVFDCILFWLGHFFNAKQKMQYYIKQQIMKKENKIIPKDWGGVFLKQVK